MDERFETMLLLWKEIDEVIEEDFDDIDRKELKKIFQKLNIDTWFIVVFIFNNEVMFKYYFENLNLSKFHKDDKLILLYKNLIGESKIKKSELKNLNILIRKIVIIIISNNNFLHDNNLKNVFEKYKTNMFLFDERFKEIEKEPKFITPSFTRFKFEKDYGKSCSNFYIKLKYLRLIDPNSLNDNFEIIFSIKKPNKNFQKINWIASIYQLKNLIKLMMDKQIIENDINYLDTIIDCFKLKNEEITKQKLDARGEPHTIEYQKDLLTKSFKLKTP